MSQYPRVLREPTTTISSPEPTARPRIVDGALVGVSLISVAVSALGLETYPSIPPWYWPIDISIGLLASASLWWSRTHPVAVGVLLILPGAISLTSTVAVLAGVYRLGSYARPQVSLPLVGVHILVALPYHAVVPVSGITWFAWLMVMLLTYALVTSFALLSRARRQVIEQMEGRARADRERFAAELTTLRRDERELIAREMHDVLAHRISLLSVHAGALEFRTRAASGIPHRALSETDVHAAAAIIRENAHLAVEELRELLMVLREGDATVPALSVARPQPSLHDVPTLVAEARRAGQRVEISIDPEAEAHTRASVQRTAFRIVQEGLTNARKHAPHSPVSVAIHSDNDHLRVEVRNPVALGLTETEIPGARAGLAGLSERVRLDGGELTHGLDAGEFALAVDLPMGRS